MLFLIEMGDVRSQNSDQRAYVRFINLTGRTVEVIWINFTGAYVCYQLLERGRFVDINTYKTHPWMAIDHVTKDRLHIGKEFVYFPQTTKEYFQNLSPKRELPLQFEARLRANITLPVHSLRYTTLLTIRNFLKVPDDVDKLELPKELINDLKKVITQRNNQVVHTFIRIG